MVSNLQPVVMPQDCNGFCFPLKPVLNPPRKLGEVLGILGFDGDAVVRITQIRGSRDNFSGILIVNSMMLNEGVNFAQKDPV